MYIILAIVIFGVLIFTHELGHFLVAKACGVKVLEFAMGMGPALLQRQGKETLYSLRLLPIGGYCAMEGEDEDTGDPRAFTAQAPWKRVLILIAGASANFLTGLLLILIVFSQSAGFTSSQIDGFMEGCPYEGAEALQAGDEFYKIDGHRTYFSSNVAEYLSRGDSVHDLVMIRDGQKIRLDNFHMSLVEYPTEDGGTELKYGLYFATVPSGGLTTLRYAWYTALDFVRSIWRSLGDLVTGAVGVRELSGPVGIVGLVNDVASSQEDRGEALLNVLYIFALIAVNLAVMNMLPFPALDGGRVFLLLVTWLIETVSHRKLNPKYEGYIHGAGFALLMGLMVFVMFNDIWKLIA